MASSSEPGTCASSSSPVSNSAMQQAMYDDASEDSSINRNNNDIEKTFGAHFNATNSLN